jgi:hypothetical protein
MFLPNDKEELKNCARWLIDRCLSTRDERDKLYQWREKYFLFGTSGMEPARINNIESHLDLVTSFLYTPDHAFYHIAAASAKDETSILKATALQDDFNEDFIETGVSDMITEAVMWSLVYDTMLAKQGWNRDREEWFMELVPPHNFGVYNEANPDLDSQSCFTHTYFLEYQTAVGKLMMAGKDADIERIKVTHSAEISPFPEMLTRMIISGSTGASLTGTMFGQVNPDYSPTTTYQAKTSVPMVRWNELWVWDDQSLDYRVIHMIDPDILVSDSKQTIETYKKATSNVIDLFGRLEKSGRGISETNPFYPGEHPFAKIQPYKKFNYFWGKAHIDALIPLQDWLLQRIDQIDDILDRQADPSRVFSGFLGLTEEKAAAFGGAGTYMYDSLPQAKMEEFKPDMPPDIFAEYKEIKAEFREVSGLTDVVAGHSERGVRSHQHAQDLKKSGSGRIKKAALNLDAPLLKIGDVGLKLKMAHDGDKLETGPDDNDKVHDFLPADAGAVKMRIDGHSYSPLFGDESREMAAVFRKFQSIDDEDFIRMMNPPSRDTLLHSLRKRKRQQKRIAQQHPELLQQKHAGGGKKK